MTLRPMMVASVDVTSLLEGVVVVLLPPYLSLGPLFLSLVLPLAIPVCAYCSPQWSVLLECLT